jgi:hypothetical protein
MTKQQVSPVLQYLLDAVPNLCFQAPRRRGWAARAHRAPHTELQKRPVSVGYMNSRALALPAHATRMDPAAQAKQQRRRMPMLVLNGTIG